MLLALDTVDAAFALVREIDIDSSAAEYAFDETHWDGPVEVGAAPTLKAPISARNVTTGVVTATKVSVSALGSDDGGERSLRYQWELADKPEGSVARFTKSDSNAAKKTDLIFDRVGDYTIQLTIVDGNGESTVTTQNITVAPVLKSFVGEYDGNALKSSATLKSAAVSQAFNVSAIDQFGRAMAVPDTAVWEMSTKPSGSDPQLTVNSGHVTVEFDQVGKYQFQVTTPEKKVFKVRFDVTADIQSFEIAAPKTQLDLGETLKLAVQGSDQFGNSIARMPKATWSVTAGGKISTSGQFTAPKSNGTFTVTATAGALTAQVALEVGQAPQASDLDGLVQTYFADGSIDRADMIAILRSVSGEGSVDADELSQLRTLVSNSDEYNIPGYVQVLASNIVHTNPANTHFQGTTLGNLTTGNTGARLDKLVDKWFLGLDRPAILPYSGVGTITYTTASGQLFNGNPSLTDQRQGLVGDCYLIASLGSIAQVNTEAIKNMFIDNHDGTFTVRFYAGALNSASTGFLSGIGVADYVTVDLALPAYSNARYFAYSNFGRSVSSSANSLWIALAEKAYAQWNETGRAGQDGTNSYAGIEGGWMGTTYAQILGYNASNYSVSSGSAKSTLISQLNNGKAVSIGSKPNATALVVGHAYTVSGYDAATDRFTLFNPWGSNQPGPLTWSQIQANCDWFASIDPSGTAAPDVQVGGSYLLVAQGVHVSRGGELLGSTVSVLEITVSTNDRLNNHDHPDDESVEMNHNTPTIAITEVLAPESDVDDESSPDESELRDLVHMEIFADIDALLADIMS